ncbi:MAG: copper chaperone PCu(A)C [Gallionellaceae bacterium]|nr:copper chaperone PCu(A)C [Gallionellaceae bacterium]
MRYAILIIALLSATPAWAAEVAISGAWARATAPGQDSAAVYLHITSQRSTQIIAVTSPLADNAEIHSMSHENGMMKMRTLEKLPLPAKQEVVLGSGGNHLMLMGLKNPLKVGDLVPLTFTLQFSDKHKKKVTVKAEVKPLTTNDEP